jgi:hypothetical protein
LQFDPVPSIIFASVSETAPGTGPPRRILLQSFQI